ncbi:drug/metabolite transporter (DMT)-like permease [Breznakia sp. PF5-3]|uniref:DMT family transporter n=1 Tax=unclassified Breznakia TaxID=2623764 RepID=UPI0024060671|nr:MULTISPECIES: DMT family transporter [unclassified Breznakia]MDF9824757.1 drug/metabolite transporter (DMT)-like permease [Breznakia sp. PM6-1]MDF9835676.1 drug/metabolite transporter (DMT)-like permease [Breznakia sp. PF5-3]MDF9837725.1 drug/metabolite transporter (DMT)-like permease [Breznakia sp. PFB2-8]MDF9859686.1 drug/metabolite transporter (DMT)-like permease [Breznakia sp. PH5-24]
MVSKMKKGYLYLFITAFCWSTAGTFIRFNSQSGLLIACIGSVVALFFNLCFYRKQWKFNSTILAVAIFQVICGITFIYANQLTSVGNAIVLQYTSMIFVLIFESVDKRRLPMLRQLVIIAIVIFGMVLFFLDSISVKGMIGNALAIISGAFFGLQFYINTKPLADAYSSTNISYCLTMLFLVFIFHDLFKVRSLEWGAMLASGVFQTALGGIFFAKGIKEVSAFTANVICMSEIILAPLWTFILFHETISIVSLFGAFIIVLGILANIYIEFHQSTD